MEFKGTKGKWEVGKGVITVIHSPKAKNDFGFGICTLHRHNKEESEIKANAQLIASAPELLEDLQEAVELFESAYSCMADGNNEGLYNALANATSRTRFKETIAKALGREADDE